MADKSGPSDELPAEEAKKLSGLVPDIVRRAVLTGPYDAAQATTALVRLVNDTDERRRLGAAARRRAARYTPEAMAAGYLDVYQRVGVRA